MTNDIKILLGIILATGLILLGGIYFFSFRQKNEETKSVDPSVLIRPDSQKISTPSATVTLVEFGDFQCPACGAYYPLLKRLEAEFSADLSVIFRNFPLQQHANARVAAYAAEAVGLQGKFWQMHDTLFENQNDWAGSNDPKGLFIEYTKDFSLDSERLKKDMELISVKEKIERDIQDGVSLGVDSTPTFYINGEKISNPQSYEDFQTLIKAAILKSPVTVSPSQAYHAHAAFKVYIRGHVFDFAKPKYQSKEGKELNEYVHLHDGNGDIIHLHKNDVSLGQFFNSLGMNFSKTCLVVTATEKYCNSDKEALHMYVNGKEITSFDTYIPQDLDKILVTFGMLSTGEKESELASISDDACRYSEKCPERGKPPTEQCVGGLGSNCE